MDDIESRIRSFIHEQFPVPERLPAGESLLESGIIDSIGVLTLVTWLEQEFGFLVEDDEVLPENLDSVASLVAYVGTKLDAAPG
ncbi:acyl carrier protein [Luteimonas viscosa]|uniref:Acyl carrier protein n=1 Tax=Luteimonas viscosa TaxID=1132694 RepID=A0A5D4XG71_9GAMM|nr:acyl carrier protein [Luteimonas viscosa]TYT23608.1 acyl carrier protein [Luteimonas viscosa]